MVYLDVFRKFPYPKEKNEQTAWLSFLLTESMEDAERLAEEYPWLEEIYRELAMLRQRPETAGTGSQDSGTGGVAGRETGIKKRK